MKISKILLATLFTILGIGFSLTAQNCIDYTETNSDPNAPGIYLVVGDYSMDFEASVNQVSLGIYGSFNEWDLSVPNQADQTFFSINGSAPVSLETIFNNPSDMVNGFLVSVLQDLPVGYDISDSWTVGTISFQKTTDSGDIENITMTQFESGLVYNCSGLQVCSDLYLDNIESDTPGWYGNSDIDLWFPLLDSGRVNIGLYGNFEQWNMFNPNQEADDVFITINDSDPISLEYISNNGLFNQIFTIDGIQISINHNSLNSTHLPNSSSNFTSSNISFFGEIEHLLIHSENGVERGLLYVCEENFVDVLGCMDNTASNYNYNATIEDGSCEYEMNCMYFVVPWGDPDHPGVFYNQQANVVFGDFSHLELGIYGNFNNWIGDLGEAAATFFSVNGGDMISLEYIYNNMPYEIDGVTISVDNTSISDNFPITNNWTSGTVVFDGQSIESIAMFQSESGYVNFCTEGVSVSGDCHDYTLDFDDPNTPGIYIADDITVLDFDGSQQQVELGIYGLFNSWNEGDYGQANQTLFTVNGLGPVSLETIYNDMPYHIGDAVIMIDPELNNDNYLADATTEWTASKVIVVGDISEISMTQFESGLLYSCTGYVTYLEDDCEDFTDFDLNDYDAGIYGLGEPTPFSFSGEQQTVTMGVYGFFNDWNESGDYGQADEMFISVNGADSVSMTTIYDNMPYDMNGVVIEIDTTEWTENYLEGSSTNWTTSTLIFEGEIDDIVVNLFESGIVFLCAESVGSGECEYTAGSMTIFNQNSTGAPWQIRNTADEIIMSGESNGVDEQVVALCLPDGCYKLCFDVIIEIFVDSVGIEMQNGLVLAVGDVENQCYNFSVNSDCEDTDIYGCTDEDATNYNPTATIDDGTCEYEECEFNSGIIVMSNPNDFDPDSDGVWSITNTNGEEFYNGILAGCDCPAETLAVCLPDGCYELCFEPNDNFMGFVSFQVGDNPNMDNIGVSGGNCYSFSVNAVCDGSEVYGCTDPTATNFNPDATVDNGTCEYEECEFNSGIIVMSNPNDFDPDSDGVWSIFNNTEVLYSGVLSGYFGSSDTLDVCLPDGCYQLLFEPNANFVGSVSFQVGDNPNLEFIGVAGGTGYGFSVNANCDGTTVLGCTDPEATNYNPEAEEDDDSCEYEEDCIDFPSFTGNSTEPGLYGGGIDTTFTYDGTYQLVSYGIYGQFIDWDVNDPSSLAHAMLISVNGADPVSLETIVNNLPYVMNDVIVNVNTNSLVNVYDGLEFWTSGVISFLGNIESVGYHLDEEGLLFACTQSMEEEDCGFDVEISYTNISNYFSFEGMGLGTEFEWSFGDGESSTLQNPTHIYPVPGDYTVCLSNTNLIDTCVDTVCQEITVAVLNIDVNIITPDNDGINDVFPLLCNDVTIFDSNGLIVATWVNQEFWYGTDNDGVTLPMGQYFVQCNDNGLIIAVTIIW